MIQRTITVQVEVTPQELADQFVGMSDADKIIAIANEIMEAQHADPSRR